MITFSFSVKLLSQKEIMRAIIPLFVVLLAIFCQINCNEGRKTISIGEIYDDIDDEATNIAPVDHTSHIVGPKTCPKGYIKVRKSTCRKLIGMKLIFQ